MGIKEKVSIIVLRKERIWYVWGLVWRLVWLKLEKYVREIRDEIRKVIMGYDI